MITKERLMEIRANILTQRDQAVGALFLIDELLKAGEEPEAMSTEELEQAIGGKLMREPEPIGQVDGD